MDCPSFTPTQFYGKSKSRRKQKRQQDVVANQLGQNTVKLPTSFSHRILGPTHCWRVFYRQTEAFSWARQMAEDVLVFAFENSDRDPADATGKRRYLVTSLDVFWHYYSQMEPSKRHHYEIIPEGWPCRLYFDLEFLKHLNPGSDGERMVNLLIQYVCMWLEAVFNISCDRSNVLDLDASTESKFSRHLIFHIPGAVFENCVAAGNFVRHIFGLLVKFIKLKTREPDTSPPLLNEHDSSYCCKHDVLIQEHRGFSNCMKTHPCMVNNCDFDEMSDEDLMVAAQICDDVISYGCSVVTTRSSDIGTNNDISSHALERETNDAISSVDVKNGTNYITSPVSIEFVTNNDISYVDLKNGTNDISSLVLQNGIKSSISYVETCKKKNTIREDTSDKMELQQVGTNRAGRADYPSSSRDGVVLCTECLTETSCMGDHWRRTSNEMMRICGQFSLNDLHSLLVTNGDGNKMTFSDLGVYTKNRNFRLYLSSKLNKNNPLIVASRNQFTPERTGKTSHEQAIFNASLVSSIRYTCDIQILTFGNQGQTKCHATENPRTGNCGSTHKEDCLEGHNCPSPFPEIDGFIESLSLSHGCRGRVRHWTYFRCSDTLLYDITGCRWCGNVQREHRSNNIMYIVDLRRGVCYQKCYDPECQAVGYRSEAMEVPSSLLLLPPSFFEDDMDEDEGKDDTDNSFSVYNGDIWEDNASNKNSFNEYHQVDKLRQDANNKNSLNNKDEFKWIDNGNSSFDDDDNLLLAAVEEVELGFPLLTQIPDLATSQGRDDADVDCDDVAKITAVEKVAVNFHQDMYPQT